MRTVMNRSFVRHHTLNDLLAIIGEPFSGDGFHIIEHNEDFSEKCPYYPFRSDHFSIIIGYDGESRVRLNMTEYTLHANEVLIIPPNAICQFIDTGRDFRCSGVAFTVKFLSESGMNLKHIEMFSFLSFNTYPHFQMSHHDADLLRHMLHVLKQKELENRPAGSSAEVVNHSFLAFIYQLGEIHGRNHDKKEIRITKKEELSMRFTKLLTEHFKEERSVLYYARLLFVTPRYLTQTIKETTGKTAGEMIDEMVMIEAKALLNNLSISIAQVAESLYFSDQFFFSKFFKKHAGMTPSEYRKNQ